MYIFRPVADQLIYQGPDTVQVYKVRSPQLCTTQVQANYNTVQ